LSLSRSYRSYGYSYPRYYGYSSYSYPSRYRYYSAPSYYRYRYSYPRYYSYSYPSRYRYYSAPRYYSYGYSYPSCEVQSAPVQPQPKLIVPQAEPPQKKVEPAPQPVPPPPPALNSNLQTTRSVSAALYRRTGLQVAANRDSDSFQTNDDPSAALGPQLSAAPVRTLISDESVPFVVPVDEPPLVAAAGPLLPPVPAPVDRSKTKVTKPAIPQNMQGIALLPIADQKPALAQRTCLVTGDLLGANGKPVKIQILGRTVYVCCKGCVAELRATPDEFLSQR
jgi:hypothetical protein